MNKTQELEKIGGCKHRLKIEVESGAFGKAREAAIRKISAAAAIPGFRPGNAPETVIKARFREEIDRAVLEELVPATYLAALKDKKLEPVSDPDISEVRMDENGLAYTAVFETVPEVRLDGYEGLSLERLGADIPEAEVNRVLEQLLAENPGLRSRAADLQEREKLRRDLRRRMEEEMNARNEQEHDERVVSQLLERAHLDVPETLVARRAVQYARDEIGHTMPDYSRRTKEEREKIAAETVEKMKPRAEKDVKASFVLLEVARREGVTVSDEEVEKRIEIMARLSGRERDDLSAKLDDAARDDLRTRIKIRKTLDVLKRRALLLEKPRIVRA